ncbi:MAG: diacylglycerol kinase family protein [Patescibacteria group bacterium]|jgi:diacylglycerol kinase family enzyme
MHVYIYDDYLNKSKYNKTINRIEIRLTDLGLNGKILRLGGIKNIKGAIQNEIRLGAKTIVAVGNNQTVGKIIGSIIDSNSSPEFPKKIVLGIIPVGNDNSIAHSFGIKNEEAACNILLARRVEKIDLGLIGGHYFLNQATIQSMGTILKIDDYTIEITKKGEVKIINLLSDKDQTIKSNPHDGLLDIYIRTQKKDWTYLTAKKLKITNPENKILIDGVLEIETPAEVTITRDLVHAIVGKERMFE